MIKPLLIASGSRSFIRCGQWDESTEMRRKKRKGNRNNSQFLLAAQAQAGKHGACPACFMLQPLSWLILARGISVLLVGRSAAAWQQVVHLAQAGLTLLASGEVGIPASADAEEVSSAG